MGKIASVIITYNRLELLKKVIVAIKNQTVKPDIIIVVNNSSSDGTGDWLANEEGLDVITQDNSGSSGGQYTGIKAAYDSGAEWIWTMDDDVLPDRDCLEKLLNADTSAEIRAPLRYTIENKPYFNDVIRFNLKNPFRSIWDGIISEKDLKNEIVSVEGITFEGPLIHRNVVEKVGLPEKPFFIFGDDTEFFIRALKNQCSIVIVRSAVLRRQLQYIDTRKSLDWKLYYVVRNIIAIDRLHGNVPVRTIRPYAYLIKWLLRCRSLGDISTVCKAFFDGWRF